MTVVCCCKSVYTERQPSSCVLHHTLSLLLETARQANTLCASTMAVLQRLQQQLPFGGWRLATWRLSTAAVGNNATFTHLAYTCSTGWWWQLCYSTAELQHHRTVLATQPTVCRRPAVTFPVAWFTNTISYERNQLRLSGLNVQA